MPPSARRCRRLWQDCLSVGFLLGLLSSAAAQDLQASPAKGPPAPGIEVKVANGLLTLHADGAPLAEVIQAIGEAGSLPVVLRGAFATPVRNSFANQPLEDAIRRLVRGDSLVMRHEDPDAASGTAALAEFRGDQ